MGLRNILVTTDFSAAAREAYPVAVSLARRFEAGLHLVHVAEPLPPFFYLQGTGVDTYVPEDPYHEELGRQIASEAEAEALKGVPLTAKLLAHRHPYVALNRYAREEAIDLIVVSTHGHTGIGYLLLGSFALNSVRHSNVPVVIYRKTEGAAAYVPKRVLVPFDFSECAHAVLPWVRTLSEAFSAQFVFLYAVEPAPPFIEAIDEFSEQFERALGDAPELVRTRFESLRRKELSEISSRFEVRAGPAYREILEYAKEWQPDLILMATHGRSGLADMLLGSVTEKVVRQASGAVLSVRARADKDRD